MLTKVAHANLLRTKSVPPNLTPDCVIRSRLLDELKHSSDRRVTAICAPAGYGKTTLALSWTKQLGIPTAWVSLDSEDNDAILFWSYVIYSLSYVLPSDIHQRIFSALYSNDVYSIPDLLLNELTLFGSQVIIALDDYHLIEDPLIHEGLNRFVDYLPSNVHVILLSRTEPPLSFTKWSAKGWLKVVSHSDLAFTEQETSEFFLNVFQIRLSQLESKYLTDNTEGWAVGLQLLGLSTKSKSTGFHENATVLNIENQVQISRYLMEEVMEKLPEDLQAFILKISIVKSFDSNLARALTNIDDPQSMISRLMKMSLFIEPLDNDGNWYRLHYLFLEFLQSKLKHQDSSLWNSLQQKAAGFLVENDRVIEAMEHLFMIQDYQSIGSLIDRRTTDLLRAGQVHTLLHWIDRIPEPQKYLQPFTWAMVAFAMIFGGNMALAEAIFDDLENRFIESEPFSDAERVFGFVCLAKSVISSAKVEMEKSIDYMHKSLKYASKEDALLWHAIRYQRVEVTLVRTHHLLKGKFIVPVDEYASYTNRLFGGTILENTPSPAYFYLAISEVYYEYNQVDKAEDFLLRALTIANVYKTTWLYVPCCTMMSRLYLAKGLYDEAFRQIETAIQFVGECLEPYWVQPLISFQVRILLRGRRLDEAKHQSTRLRIIPGDMIHRGKHYEHLAMVRLYIDTQDYMEALRVVTELRAMAKVEGQHYTYVETTVLKAVVEWGLGRKESAYSSLYEALSLGQKYNYCRVFLDEESVHDLFRSFIMVKNRTWRESISPDYLNKLLSLLPDDSTTAEPVCMQSLTRRETDILSLLANGLSNQEIGERLHLTVGSVKIYVNRIYKKLQVSNRSQATLKAVELGITAEI